MRSFVSSQEQHRLDTRNKMTTDDLTCHSPEDRPGQGIATSRISASASRTDLRGQLMVLLLILIAQNHLAAAQQAHQTQQPQTQSPSHVHHYPQFPTFGNRNVQLSSRQLGPNGLQFFGPQLQPQSQPQFVANDNKESFGLPDSYVEKVIWPYDSFDHELLYSNGSNAASNVIEHKRYVESVSSRCLTSTVMENPMALEPSFILIRPQGETRLPATSHASQIMAAGFEPNKPTVFIIHGFTQSYPETSWLRHTRGLFERHQRVSGVNLFIMDWSKASRSSYAQAAAAVSGMGSFLSNFLLKLCTELGTNRLWIHLVGHSLGAHLAGFAGKRIRPRVGRITALDPAGPCFGKILSNSATDRLSPDDAIEVDVYHYDDDFLGLPGQHGQFDVFVNGGSNQPGCADNVNAMVGAVFTILFRLNRVMSESHTRSTEVATVPLSQNNCQLVAYECRDYVAFSLGECARCDDFNGQCFLMSFDYQYNNHEDPNALMAQKQQQPQPQPQQSNFYGYRSASAPAPPLRTSFPGKRLYIQTSDKEVYCLQHYQVLVKFEPGPELAQQAKRQKWRLYLELASDSNQRFNFSAFNQMAPNVFSYLLLDEGRPTRIRSARLQARTLNGSPVPLVGVPRAGASRPGQSTGKQSSGASFQVFAIEIQYMSDINPQVRRLMSSRLCPAGAEQNSIADSSSTEVDTANEWLHFDECL